VGGLSADGELADSEVALWVSLFPKFGGDCLFRVDTDLTDDGRVGRMRGGEYEVWPPAREVRCMEAGPHPCKPDPTEQALEDVLNPTFILAFNPSAQTSGPNSH
jgi:hypothetical protein